MKIYKSIILVGVLYGSVTWSLILRGKYRLRVFQKSFSRRTLGVHKYSDTKRINL